MKSNLQTLLNRKHFFNIISTTNSTTEYTLAEASQILLKNIYINWHQYLNTKTEKVMPIYLDNASKHDESKLPFGLIKHIQPDFKNKIFKHDLNEFTSLNKTVLDFTVKIPRAECMRYFTQWQRYRKYWWSSVSISLIQIIQFLSIGSSLISSLKGNSYQCSCYLVVSFVQCEIGHKIYFILLLT